MLKTFFSTSIMVILGAVLTVFSACSHGPKVGWEHRTVQGTVTLDGQPLPNADIVFSFSEGAVAGKSDNNGNYMVENVFIGNVVVSVSSLRDTGKTRKNAVTGVQAIQENIVPAKYGYGRGIKMEITPNNEEVNLILTSK